MSFSNSGIATTRSYDVQHPVPTSGDRVYAEDIWVAESSLGNFSGSILTPFDNLHSAITDTTNNNPKEILFHFNGSLGTTFIGLGSLAGELSNAEIFFLNSGEILTQVIDESADSTKYTSRGFPLPPTTGANGILLRFHTTDTISISNFYITKYRFVVSRIQAVRPDGVVIDVAATDSGNLKTSNAESGLAIAKGEVEGTSFIHKFGNAPDFDKNAGFVTIWDGADDGKAWELNQYVYSTTADIDSISSSDNGDTQLVEIQGLDSDFLLVTQTVTLSGQARQAFGTNLIRIFRVKNIGSVDFAGTVVAYVNTAITGGVPNDNTKIRAVVHIGNNQTEMAIFTVPAGKTGYMRDWYASTSAAKKDSSHVIKIFARPFGQVFQLKHTSSIIESGSSHIKHDYIEPEVFTEKTDVEIKTDTDQDAASVAAGFDIVLVDN